MDFITKFGKLKKKFDVIDAEKLGESVAIQVNMTDDDCGGAFYISNIEGTFSVEPYDYRDHTAMITLKAADFEKLIGRKLELSKALEKDLAQIEGAAEHIAAVLNLFPVPEKKTAKKTTQKKTVKKAAPKADVKETKETKPAAVKKTAAKKADEPKKPAAAAKKEETKKADVKAEPKKAETKKSETKTK